MLLLNYPIVATIVVAKVISLLTAFDNISYVYTFLNHHNRIQINPFFINKKKSER